VRVYYRESASLNALVGGIPGFGRTDDKYLRLDAVFLLSVPAVLLLFPAALASFHYRYSIPTIPFFGSAGALVASLLWRRISLSTRPRAGCLPGSHRLQETFCRLTKVQSLVSPDAIVALHRA
jgi:hypothetical protein